MRLSRSTSLLLAILLVLLLPSCASRDREREAVEELQTSFREASQIMFTAAVSADYGERLFNFGINYSGTVSAGTITLTDPDIIAGVTVTLSDGGATLAFEDAEIFTGEILPDGLSPVDAVPMLLAAWSDGLVTETVEEKLDDDDCLAALFRIDERVNARTWFTLATGLPLRSEVYLDEFTVLTLDFQDVIME